MEPNRNVDNVRRVEIRLDDSPRDRRIAAWHYNNVLEGRNTTELIKLILDEIITGHSSITGKPIREVQEQPAEGNPIAEALNAFQD